MLQIMLMKQSLLLLMVSLEPADWHAQLQQSNKVFEAGKTYEVSTLLKEDTTIKVEVTNGSAEQTALKEVLLPS